MHLRSRAGSSGSKRARLLAGTMLLATMALVVLPATALANDAHLTIQKTFDSATATAGATIGFTITVQIHTDDSQDPLCVVVSPTTVQCPARNVVVTDQLPTTPPGLSWTIDAAHSNPGCDIGVTNVGYLTCQWGDLVATNESRTVHVVSSTLPGPAGTCGTVINPLAHAAYRWADGTELTADATNAQTVVTCQTVTPPPTPKPTPTGSVRGATSPPNPVVTLPPTDVSGPGNSSTPGHDANLTIIMLIGLSSAIVVAIARKPARR
jgi:hypothetical protein